MENINIIIGVLIILVIGLIVWIVYLNNKINNKSTSLFESFKANELSAIRKVMEDSAKQEAKANMEMWKMEWETSIRRDAINRSQSVILGKVSEHAVPWHSTFPYNPKDLRFIGSPIDMIVFDGSDEEKEDIKIYFLEIKTGNSYLSKKQKLIRNAVTNKNVYWREIKI